MHCLCNQNVAFVNLRRPTLFHNSSHYLCFQKLRPWSHFLSAVKRKSLLVPLHFTEKEKHVKCCFIFFHNVPMQGTLKASVSFQNSILLFCFEQLSNLADLPPKLNKLMCNLLRGDLEAAIVIILIMYFFYLHNYLTMFVPLLYLYSYSTCNTSDT